VKRPEFKRPSIGRSPINRGPDVRVPGFLSDLYADLRDRRLLPLVVLLLVGIVAAPILIGGSKKEPEVAPIPSSGVAVDRTSFSVVPASTELQEYKKRLAHRRSVNPFNPFSATKHRTPTREEFAEAAAAAAAANAPATAPETGTSTGGSTAAPGNGPTTTTVVKKPVVKATLKAQVGVAAVVKAGFVGSEPKQLELENQTKLPPNNPAIVFNGTSKKGAALFLMTAQVTEFSGDGHCVLGGSLCQMIELKEGSSETFAIGYGETRYKVQLLGFEPIVKEEVIEAEGKKLRVPGKEKGKQTSPHNFGTEPSPRWLLR
jgi:hypothetical protein